MTGNNKQQLVSQWIETLSPESMKKLLFDCVMELIVTECVNIRPKESQDDEYGGVPYWECNGDRLVS